MAGASHRWHKQQQYVVLWEHGWGQATGHAASRNKVQSGSESTSHGKVGCARKLEATVAQQGTHQPSGCHVHPIVCSGLAQQEVAGLAASLQLPPAQVTTALGQLSCPSLCVRTPSVPSWPLWGCCQGSAPPPRAPLQWQRLGEQGLSMEFNGVPMARAMLTPGPRTPQRQEPVPLGCVDPVQPQEPSVPLPSPACHLCQQPPTSPGRDRRTLGFSWHGATRNPAARQREEGKLSQERGKRCRGSIACVLRVYPSIPSSSPQGMQDGAVPTCWQVWAGQEQGRAVDALQCMWEEGDPGAIPNSITQCCLCVQLSPCQGWLWSEPWCRM